MSKVFTALFIVCLAAGYSSSQVSRNMRLLKHMPRFDYTSACWGYEPGVREYIIYGWKQGTSIVDITDDNNIHEVSYIPGRISGWREMKIYRNYLYVVSEADSSGIQIIDLGHLPDSAQLVSTYFFEGYRRAHTISIYGHCLYINGSNYGAGGIAVIDISNPLMPVKIGEWEDDYVHDCRVINDTIWACNPLTGRVSVIDASIKNNIRTVTSWVNGSYPVPHNCALSQDNRYLFVCDENFVNPGKVKIWDVTDKHDITFAGQWSVPGTSHSVHNIEIFGDYAFLSYYGEGVRVLDIRNPVAPDEIAWYKTTACWSVYYFRSGKIAASDIYDGLYVFRTETPINVINYNIEVNNVSLGQNYPNPFNPVTKFKFQIPKSGVVRLTVYNTLGKEVQTLVNEQLSAGTYEADFNGSNLPSGVYYYKLGVEDFSETKKMVLIK